jgi:hypothetical protein
MRSRADVSPRGGEPRGTVASSPRAIETLRETASTCVAGALDDGVVTRDELSGCAAVVGRHPEQEALLDLLQQQQFFGVFDVAGVVHGFDGRVGLQEVQDLATPTERAAWLLNHLWEEDQVLEIALARKLLKENLFERIAARSGEPGVIEDADVGLYSVSEE